jgi:hypothetical protein
MWRLRQSGQDVKEGIMTIEEAVKEISSLVERKTASSRDGARPGV